MTPWTFKHAIRSASMLLLPVGAALSLLLTPSLAAPPGASTIPWEPAAVLFGATLGYAVVVFRRPRRLCGGAYFLVAGFAWFGAAIWTRSVVAEIERPLLLFVASGANLAGALLTDDALGGVLRRRAPWLEAHPWSAALGAGGLFGLLVAGLDLAVRHEPLGALTRGLLWAAVGVLFHRVTFPAAIG
jgi:hypothetical protein